MKKLIALTAGLLLTTSAFASTFTVSQNSTIKTDSFQTKAEAYNAGFDLTDALKQMENSQLRKELSLWAYNSVNDITIDDSQVVIQETATERGNIEYRAIINLDYHFNAHESRN